MEIYRNIITKQQAEDILDRLLEQYPLLAKENSHIEEHNQFLEDLKVLPLVYFPHLQGTVCSFIIISTVTELQPYAGDSWHTDGPDTETTVLLYLQGDPDCGGEFITEFEQHKFDTGTAFVLSSSILHRVTGYNSHRARIALKWKIRNEQ